MHALHPALLIELAHSQIDDLVRTASRASVLGASDVPDRRRGGHRRLRPRRRTVA
jgi:hypothetical protein